LFIPESQAERRLTPSGYSLAKEGSCASEVPGALAQPTRPRPVIGCVFIRSRPPSCAGDRVFRMGMEMGGIGGCFLMFLE